MIEGIEKFKERFAEYSDCYTIIGGTACDILMSEADTDFRATKDIDMILIMEARYKEFAGIFWEFIKEGGYRCGWRNSENTHFYRFTDPKPSYPSMIELFSREPDYISDIPSGIVPLHISDDVSSLSAILLNDDFYRFMLDGRLTVDDICILDAEHLIPFKMYAWLDLKDRKENGEHVNERDYKKHKYDVFRLLQIVSRDKKVTSFGLVEESIQRFLKEITNENIPFQQLGLPFDLEVALGYLKDIYL